MEYIYNQILTEFELDNDNLPLNAGSVVLSTVLDSTQGSRQLSKLVNVILSMGLNGILTASNAKLTPRADILINYIKTALIHVVKVKPNITVSECLKSRNLIKMLNSGFTPHYWVSELFKKIS